MSIISTLHLNTRTDAIMRNGNVSTFIVDWDNIFHGKTGTCRVYAKMRGSIQDYVGAPIQYGTLNASFSSGGYSNTNGVPLAPITQKPINASSFFYVGETRPNQAPTINIPMGKGMFNVFYNV
jgi:hypothetical protein